MTTNEQMERAPELSNLEDDLVLVDAPQQTKQNAPYGYYELGLRAEMLEVELKAACAACTHLDEKLKEAEARAERAEKALAAAPSQLALDHLNEVASDAMETNEQLKAKLQAVETDRDEWIQVSRDWRSRAESAEADVRAVRDLLKKPGCWSEWARECLAVISGGGK